jgi:hypothetical protein
MEELLEKSSETVESVVSPCGAWPEARFWIAKPSESERNRSSQSEQFRSDSLGFAGVFGI